MTRLQGSVGRGGTNLPEDVRLVQRLLSGRAGIGKVDVDGKVGPQTIAAIERFQRDTVGLRHPDGRVDPGGRTFRALRSVQAPVGPPTSPGVPGVPGAPSLAGGPPRPSPGGAPTPGSTGAGPVGRSAQPAPASGTGPRTPQDREARRRFVRSAVKETGLTTRIIDAIHPHFAGKRATVISGYLNDSDLFWKVNYHWDYLLWMLDHSATLPVESSVQSRLRSLAAGLRACAPDPSSGYRTSPIGKPEDRSTMSQLTQRHKVVSQAKRAFGDLTAREGLKRLSSRSTKCFDLAAAAVAHPGTSKHGTGYALDIEGDNALIRDTCSRLGASTVFDEKSHVHVEFANGVSGAR